MKTIEKFCKENNVVVGKERCSDGYGFYYLEFPSGERLFLCGVGVSVSRLMRRVQSEFKKGAGQ